jgi:hypothetical protein
VPFDGEVQTASRDNGLFNSSLSDLTLMTDLGHNDADVYLSARMHLPFLLAGHSA